jgi:single-strand DNA-binding protein
MRNINRVMLTGNLTRDPELRTASGGMAICKLGLAVNESYKSGDEWKERANFFDITVFGRQAESCAQYLRKGRAIAVDGRLRFEQWEKDGQKRSRVVVVADTVQFLSDGRGSGSGDSDGYRMEGSSSASDSGGYRMESSVGATDDDIPF